jgi:hypothetical protein
VLSRSRRYGKTKFGETMLFPREMSEIELIVPSKDLLTVTKVLSGYGVFHQTDSNYPGVASGSSNTWQETAGHYSALERRIQTLMQQLDIDEGRPPSKDYGAMIDLEKLRSTVEQLEAEVRSSTDELSEQRKRLEQLENIVRQLEPVEEVDIDISSLRDSRYMFSMLGQMPAANLERIFEPFFTTRLGQGGSGLGLHILFNLVTGLLNGRVGVNSEHGSGTEFVFDLPLSAPVIADTAYLD